MLLAAADNATLADHLAGELAQVESCFAAELVSDLPCVNELVKHIERYRGKMLRPCLVLASGLASSGSPDSDGLTPAHSVVGAVVEMVHMATLVHDDILDEAALRRRGATINQLRGNETAVMLGDYLISHAYHLCSSLGKPALSQIIAHATNTVCEGELLQLASRNDWALDESVYFRIIRRKTASLCGTCCRLGAMLSGASDKQAMKLHAFGQKLGVAFQIIDDVLDLVGKPDTVGKTLGLDVRKGKLTLPIIHYLNTAQADDRQQILALLQQQAEAAADQSDWQPDREDHALTARLRERLEANCSLRYAHQRAEQLVEQARNELEDVAPSPARSYLLQLADAVVQRQL